MRYAILSTVALLAALGVSNARHQDRVCAGTSNRAMCELSINAGHSDQAARDAGNGIFAGAR